MRYPMRTERQKDNEIKLTIGTYQVLRRLLHGVSVRLPKDEKSVNALNEDFHE